MEWIAWIAWWTACLLVGLASGWFMAGGKNSTRLAVRGSRIADSWRLRFVGQTKKHAEVVGARCLHTSVPWPVVTSDRMLVAWLCEDCMEQRDTFTSPPVKRKVICNHPEVDEVRSMDSAVIYRWCKRCGQTMHVVEEFYFEAMPVNGEEKPWAVYRSGKPRRYG